MKTMLEERMAKDGFMVLCIGVTEDDPPFTYTIGLTETFKHPELIISGWFSQELFNTIVGKAIDWLRKGKRLDQAPEILGVIQIQDGDATVPGLLGCRKVAAEYKSELMCVAARRYPEFEGIQLVIPDRQNKLPWDENCDPEWLNAQSVLY